MIRGRRSLKLGIWGHYGGANLGDGCVVDAIIHNVRARRPDAEFLGISLNTRDTCARYGIAAFPMHRWQQPCRPGTPPRPQPGGRLAKAFQRSVLAELAFYVRAIWRLRGFDAVLVAGSGQVYDDWDGPWEHPKNLLKWSLLTRLARVPLGLLCVGVGPINHDTSRRLLRAAIGRAFHMSFRDDDSRRVAAERLGLRRNDGVYIDLAFSLPMAALEAPAPSPPADGRAPVIGISTMAYEDPRYWPHRDASKHASFLETLAQFAAELARRGCRLRLLYTDRADLRIGQEFKALLRDRHRVDTEAVVMDEDTPDYHVLLRQIAACDAVVGVRYHSHVLPLLAGKPVLGIAYHPKTVEVMRTMGQADYCLDIRELRTEDLLERFDALMACRHEIGRSLVPRVAEERRRLDHLYDSLFGPVTEGTPTT